MCVCVWQRTWELRREVQRAQRPGGQVRQAGAGQVRRMHQQVQLRQVRLERSHTYIYVGDEKVTYIYI